MKNSRQQIEVVDRPIDIPKAGICNIQQGWRGRPRTVKPKFWAGRRESWLPVLNADILIPGDKHRLHFQKWLFSQFFPKVRCFQYPQLLSFLSATDLLVLPTRDRGPWRTSEVNMLESGRRGPSLIPESLSGKHKAIHQCNLDCIVYVLLWNIKKYLLRCFITVFKRFIFLNFYYF